MEPRRISESVRSRIHSLRKEYAEKRLNLENNQRPLESYWDSYLEAMRDSDQINRLKLIPKYTSFDVFGLNDGGVVVALEDIGVKLDPYTVEHAIKYRRMTEALYKRCVKAVEAFNAERESAA